LFDWTIAIGVVVLLGLISAQVRLLTPRIKVQLNKQNSTQNEPNLTDTLRNSIQRISESKFEDKIDPSLFSKFQKNLDRTTEKANNPVSKKESKDQSHSDDEQEVILSISKTKEKEAPSAASKAKKRSSSKAKTAGKITYPGAGPSKKPSSPTTGAVANSQSLAEIPSEPLGSIFDDIKDNEDGMTNNPAIVSQRKKRVTEPQKKESNKLFEGLDEPLESIETLTQNDLLPKNSDPETDLKLILSLSKKSLEEKDYKTGLATIEQFLLSSESKELQQDKLIELFNIKAELEFYESKFEQSSQTFEKLLKKYLPKENSQYLPILEKAIELFTNAKKQELALPFLFNALNEYRQFGDHKKMDETYFKIEKGYRNQEDWKRLVKTYQNHLTIKKVQKDFKGQLELLDHLGKLLYDQKDADGSKECYEQSIAIKAEMEQQINNEQ